MIIRWIGNKFIETKKSIKDNGKNAFGHMKKGRFWSAAKSGGRAMLGVGKIGAGAAGVVVVGAAGVAAAATTGVVLAPAAGVTAHIGAGVGVAAVLGVTTLGAIAVKSSSTDKK